MPLKKNKRSPLLLENLGEWGFLNRILPLAAGFKRERFIVPTGDDAAVLKAPWRPVLSIDGIVQGTHFKLDWLPGFHRRAGFSMGRGLGWKLMGGSLSDLAAMGDVRKRWALVFLGAPPRTPAGLLMDIFQGIQDYTRRFDCVLAGGDVVRSDVLTLVAAVGGELKNKTPLTRRGARPGDLLCVAGTVGDASLGLAALENRCGSLSSADRRFFIRRFFESVPLFQVGKALAGAKGVTSLMDLSDPLDQSLRILAAASGVGFEVHIDHLPRSERFLKMGVGAAMNLGGEDYALLFSVDKAEAPKMMRGLKGAVIGRVTERRSGIHFFHRGGPVDMKASSFRHF